VVGGVGAKDDVAPAPALPNADVIEAKADCGVIVDPPIALGADAAVPKADCGTVKDPLTALDASDAELKAFCAGAAGVKALCTCPGAPNALCVGLGPPNEGCPNADPCTGADAKPDVWDAKEGNPLPGPLPAFPNADDGVANAPVLDAEEPNAPDAGLTNDGCPKADVS